MADEKLTSVTTYLIIAFIVGIFATFITQFASNLNKNPNADLSNSSQTYITSLTGEQPFDYYNKSLYTNADGEIVEDIHAGSSNDNENDFSLDFVFAKKKTSALKVFTKAIFTTPKFILEDIFQFKLGNGWKEFVDLLSFLWGLMLFVTFLFLIIGRR